MPPETAAKRASLGAFGLALISLALWSATVPLTRSMQGMNGTMGLGAVAYVALWTLMMAAMMLPSVAPVALSYQRVIKEARRVRLTLFVGGYLAVWSGAGIVAFILGRAVEAAIHAGTGSVFAATVFAVAGLYQLSPLKDRCLRHCRSPVSLLMRYSSFKGRLRDASVGAHHGAYCLGCCWALFAVLVVMGSMSLPLMIGLGCVVLLEKRWAHGVGLSRVVAVGCVAAAVLLIIEPSWLSGLLPTEHRQMEM